MNEGFDRLMPKLRNEAKGVWHAANTQYLLAIAVVNTSTPALSRLQAWVARKHRSHRTNEGSSEAQVLQRSVISLVEDARETGTSFSSVLHQRSFLQSCFGTERAATRSPVSPSRAWTLLGGASVRRSVKAVKLSCQALGCSSLDSGVAAGHPGSMWRRT